MYNSANYIHLWTDSMFMKGKKIKTFCKILSKWIEIFLELTITVIPSDNVVIFCHIFGRKNPSNYVPDCWSNVKNIGAVQNFGKFYRDFNKVSPNNYRSVCVTVMCQYDVCQCSVRDWSSSRTILWSLFLWFCRQGWIDGGRCSQSTVRDSFL